MSKKWPIFAYDSTDRLREKRTRGGRGSKIPKILRTYLMDAPLLHLTCQCFASGCIIPNYARGKIWIQT